MYDVLVAKQAPHDKCRAIGMCSSCCTHNDVASVGVLWCCCSTWMHGMLMCGCSCLCVVAQVWCCDWLVCVFVCVHVCAMCVRLCTWCWAAHPLAWQCGALARKWGCMHQGKKAGRVCCSFRCMASVGRVGEPKENQIANATQKRGHTLQTVESSNSRSN